MPKIKPKGKGGRGNGSGYRLNQNFSDRKRIAKDERAKQRALYLSTLPKNRWKRLAYRMHPRRLAAYWFSREGAIMALKVTGVGIIVLFFLIVGLFAYLRKDLPQIKGLAGSNLGGSITYYDSTGKVVLWRDYDAVKRIPVDQDQMSPYIREATVAVEDKNFYHHGAFDAGAIVRAGLHDLVGHGGLQGGSTITQQLVKLNEQWTNNRTITRKIKELILAIELEREYSKDEILTGYLNAAPYGGIEYGVEAASRDYFHTSAKDLTLAQASFLAGIPQSPSYYSPYSSHKWNSEITGTSGFGKQAILNRQHYILDLMANQGYITQAQANKAKKVDILAQIHRLEPKYHGIKAPYFVLTAKRALEEKYGAQTVKRGGWKVVTTVNLKLQKLAEKEVQDDLPTVKAYGGDVAAFVAEDVHTGQVVALVGGPDFSNPVYGKINYVESPIPPGSSFKPYDYSAFIQDKHAGAGTVVYDSQGPLPGWPCTNRSLPDDGGNCLWDYDFNYPGALTLRYDLAGSRNVPAVKVNLMVGTQKVINLAETMMNGSPNAGFGYNCYSDVNLTKKTQCFGASAIGDGAFLHLDEHVNGLATIARLGKWIPRTYIKKITDASGKTIYQWTQPKGKQVLGKDAAWIVDNMLSDPRASYLLNFQKFQHQPNGWHFAVKTGTTNDNYDGLMTSWSTQYAAVTWVGYHTRNKSMLGHHMEDMTEPIIRGWMEGAHADLPAVNWPKPSSVQKLPAYVRTAGIGTGAEFPSPSMDYYPAAYKPSGGQGSVTIDKVSGKLATNCTPPLAKVVITGGNANSFAIDEFYNGGVSSTGYSGHDDVHNCDDKPPTVVVTVPSKCDENDCTITITPFAGTHPLSSSKFDSNLVVKVDGKTIATFHPKNDGVPETVSYTPTKTGTVNVTATLTDSVLYQANDSESMDTTAPPKDTTTGGTSTGGDDGTQSTTNPGGITTPGGGQ